MSKEKRVGFLFILSWEKFSVQTGEGGGFDTISWVFGVAKTNAILCHFKLNPLMANEAMKVLTWGMNWYSFFSWFKMEKGPIQQMKE